MHEKGIGDVGMKCPNYLCLRPSWRRNVKNLHRCYQIMT